MRQAAILSGFDDMGKGLGRGVDPIRPSKRSSRLRKCCDHQAVPIGESLAVTARPDALFTDQQQFRLQRREPSVIGYGLALLCTALADDRLAFPAMRSGQLEIPGERGRIAAERGFDLLLAPCVEQPLLAVAV